MSSNIQRSQGRGAAYKFDRGGMPAEMGPYIGEVKNNIDPTRSGRLEVYIEQFGGKNPSDRSLWRTVNYIPPFYGVTPHNNATSSDGAGSYKGNPQSYGMWFTPPDIGVKVICFFVAGDPNQGYYIGCVPAPGITHMIPAIGATNEFKIQNATQQRLATGANARQLPVVEANFYNKSVDNNPKFFDVVKPVHSYVFAVLAQQGLLGDTIRGPITSSSQRETPSATFGISTPGRPIYQGGLSDKDIKAKVATGKIKLSDLKVEGRRGGHSIVMDDGNAVGVDNLVRIRTSKGHQITMSDDGDCFYIIHANGQSWLEFGSEGTVDVYATNSVNVRTEGTVNLHSDKDININAGGNLNLRGKTVAIESVGGMSLAASKSLTMQGKLSVGIDSTGSVAIKSGAIGSWSSTGILNLKGSLLNLNGPIPGTPVLSPKPIQLYKLDDVSFSPGQGWTVQQGKIQSIVTRLPTHEPYPYHGTGVPITVDYSEGSGGGGAGVENVAVDQAIAEVESQPVQDPITNESVLSTEPATESIGSLNTGQVTGLIAQAKQAVGQDFNVASVSKGIGEFGLDPKQLEAAGLLKPGTAKLLTAVGNVTPTAADIAEAGKTGLSPQAVAQGRQVLDKLSSPTLWTGQGGVNSLTGLLGNKNLQNNVQQGLMSSALTGLRSTGLATGAESVQKLGALVQSATKFGVGDTTAWVNGVASSEISKAVGISVKDAQFAVNFVTTKIGGQLGDLTSLGNSSVASALGGVTSQITGVTGQLDSALKGALGTATGQLTTALEGLTGPLRGLGGLGDSITSLSGLTGLSGLAGGLGGLLSGGLNNALSGVLGSLSGPLASALGGQLSGALGGALSNVFGGALGNLGGLASLGGLFGGGGGAVPARYAVNTVKRTALDSTINASLGDSKIPPLTYDISG
jgi:hypothetical protein